MSWEDGDVDDGTNSDDSPYALAFALLGGTILAGISVLLIWWYVSLGDPTPMSR